VLPEVEESLLLPEAEGVLLLEPDGALLLDEPEGELLLEDAEGVLLPDELAPEELLSELLPDDEAPAPELDLSDDEAPAAPELDLSDDDDFEELAPLAAEPLTPRAERVSWFSSPLPWMPFCCWNCCSACLVFGPITPSIWPTSMPWSFSFCCTCLMVSWSWWPDIPDFLLLPPAPAWLLCDWPPELAPWLL
jgi:hypothetical protein